MLNNLIEESLTGNSDIELAISNVLAAQAQLTLINSYRFPQINLQGGTNRTKNSKETKAPNEPKFSNNFGLASVLNYELDLWRQPPTLTNQLKKLSLQVSIARQR
ncbi:TolC family protein [Rickettsia japonica]|uniref:TolC family protein n=1 Tax=Rickettsia japonica TaxID=35790 RepID=UPI0021C407A8|nr:TolC family protein [Rickettsia japonica]